MRIMNILHQSKIQFPPLTESLCIKSKSTIILILILSLINGQHFVSADPYEIIIFEQEQFLKNVHNQSLIIRPLLKKYTNPKWSLIVRNELFINNNRPNLENMGNRWIGKGTGFFTGFNLSYSNKYISLRIEPFYLFDQNKYTKNVNRKFPYGDDPNIFNVLNDNRYFIEQPYVTYGFRESKLFIHYKQIGFGFSNANMWWGPGVHTSLTMTNNTTGFPHLMIGTLNEKRIRNIGINVRYTFSQLNKVSGNPYYTALVWSARFYTQPIITIGLSRNYLSGGLPTDRPFTIWDAALLPFEALFIDTKLKKYPSEWEAHDFWDQTMAGFLTIDFPKSGLQLFIELGTDDHRQNLMDLRSQPDHNSASIIGLRKYGFFNNRFLLGGFEYANIKQSYTYKFRGGGHWWWKHDYAYSTYDGRRWAAHSGSDSDDFYLFFGYNGNNWTFIPGFNYERHGIISGNPPEVKIEFRFDIRFIYKNYRMNIYYEKEIVNNSEFVPDNKLRSNIFWLGLEKDLSGLINGLSD